MVLQEEAFLKRYLEFCRVKCAPALSEAAGQVLVNEYVQLREEVRSPALLQPWKSFKVQV